MDEHQRGIILSGGITLGPGSYGYQFNEGEFWSLIRKCLLYWDKLEWPEISLTPVNGGPDGDYLESAGVLRRPQILMGKWLEPGELDYEHAVDLRLGKLFESLERWRPGCWSLGQSSKVNRSGPPESERRAVEFALYNMLPVPSDCVSIADILEFRDRYPAELTALRSALDDLYGSVVTAGDPARARLIAQTRLARAIKDVEDALHGKRVANWRSSFSVDFKLTDVAEKTAAGAAVSALAGLPISVGAFAGAVASICKVQISRVPAPQIVQKGPYAYVYHVGRELRS